MFMVEQTRLSKGLGAKQGRLARVLTGKPAQGNPCTHLSDSQLGAIRTAMQLFVDDDLSRGLEVDRRLYCEACERKRPAAGFIQYGRYMLCNACATEYEIVRAGGLAMNIGHFVRDKHFGESYALELLCDG